MRSISQKFEQEYTDYYIKKVTSLKNKYPEITGGNRRTGKALKNICFFIWSYTKEEDEETIDLLFKASVLLSAQDDFFDNSQISDQKKEEFHSTCTNMIEENEYRTLNQSRQSQELIILWKEIFQEVRHAPSHLYNFWRKKTQELNDAMQIENHSLKTKKVAFHEYMKTAIDSIGIMFIWATYFTKKDVSKNSLRELEPLLFAGAQIARLSNDIAGHREGKNRMNALNTIEYERKPKKYIFGLLKKEQQEFNKKLREVIVKDDIKYTLKNSTEFLAEFYKTSNFDQ